MNIITDLDEVKNLIKEADKLLIGIGEDFAYQDWLGEISDYRTNCDKIVDNNCQWVLPYVNAYFLKDANELQLAYTNLQKLVNEKDYFILTASMDDIISNYDFRKDRIVAPCGSYRNVQIQENGKISIIPTERSLFHQIEECIKLKSGYEKLPKNVQFNSLYTEGYDEAGYQNEWTNYTKWLQGTLNKKVCIFELGSQMMFANVLRFRFEKIVSLNQKAKLLRVNKQLFQIPEEIAFKGYSITENAVDFMAKFV